MICAYTAICEEDACWIDQYLAEVDRLGLRFAIHLDRCSDRTMKALTRHPGCIGQTLNSNHKVEFNETHKQGVFDLAVKSGADWAMAWDVDETYAKDAPERLKEIEGLKADYVDTKWVNLWDDPQHIRVDGPFSGGHRVKFYKLNAVRRWVFTGPITNGPKHKDGPEPVLDRFHELVCLHWGMMTHDMRVQHKERWDRIYSAAVGANPYQFWKFALDPDYPATVSKHDYF